jgi:TRAP transporter TAXI family solute receptor
MSKRKMVYGLLLLLFISGAFSFGAPSKAEAAQQLTFGTAAPTGGWMMLGSAVSKVVNDKVAGVNLTPVPSPRGSVENIETIMKGEREFGLTMANIAMLGKQGAEPFKAQVKGVSGWFSAHYGYWYLLTRADSKIRTVADLKGKRVAIGNPGDGDEALNKEVFARLGLKWTDFKPEYSGFSSALDLIKQNQIDAFAYVAAPKLPSLTELMTTKKLRMVAIAPASLKKLAADLPYVVLRPMSRKDYPALEMPEEATMVSMNHIVICSEKLDTELVYKMTKAVFANLDSIRQVSKAFEVITLKSAVSGMPIPFHPGAVKLYKELGLMK